MSKFSKIAIVVGLGLVPLLVLAQTPAGPAPDAIRDINGVILVLNRIINAIFGLLMAIAALLVLYAAYNYLTAGGDEAKIETAKNTLIYAAVGIGVALLAQGFGSIIRNILGV